MPQANIDRACKILTDVELLTEEELIHAFRSDQSFATLVNVSLDS